MFQLSKILASLSLATALALTPACGGGEKPPAPLSQHFDDMYIAAIPLDQKQAIVQTQQDYSVGKMENAKSEADYNSATTELEIARNDLKAARLEVDSANATRKAAEASADTNRINDATKGSHAADSVERAAEARLRYVEAYRDYQRIHGWYTAANMYWHESAFELAKADLAQKNNIAPKGFTYGRFSAQESERRNSVEARKRRSEDAHHRAQDARDNWLHAQEQAERETGKRNQYTDWMAPGASGNPSLPQ